MQSLVINKIIQDEENNREQFRSKQQALVTELVDIPFLKTLGMKHGTKFLDVGCGNCAALGKIASLFRSVKFTAIDNNSDSINAAKRYLCFLDNVKTMVGDAYNTGFANNSFDVVYSRFALQHLENPLEALSEARRITRKGGKVCVVDIDDDLQVSVPDLNALDRLRKVHKKKKFIKKYGNRFIGRQVAAYMAELDFKEIKIIPYAITSLEVGLRGFYEMALSAVPNAAAEFESDLTDENLWAEIEREAEKCNAIMVVLAVCGTV